MKTAVYLRCPTCGVPHNVPTNLQTWVCPRCGHNMERELRKAIRSEERLAKQNQRWEKQKQRAAEKKTAEQQAAEQRKREEAKARREFAEAHKDDTSRISRAAHKLIKDSGFPYSYKLLLIYPTKGRVLLSVTESVATMPFEESGGGMSWRDCSLRRWLNGEFLSSLPTSLKKRLVTESHSYKGGSSGTLTYYSSEQIFVLGEQDLDSNGEPLYKSLGITGFWLRDEASPSKAKLGSTRPAGQSPKSLSAKVLPVMLLQIE